MLVVLPRWISNGLPSGAPKNFLLLNSILESMGVGARGPFPKISEAMDGRREAQMGEASVYEAKLHAQPNDSNL
jgi:hypothetical protein